VIVPVNDRLNNRKKGGVKEMMWGYWGHPGWGMMGIGFVFMILFWAVIVGLIVWGVRHFSRRHNYSGNDSAMEIARQRYARGEISKEQFEQLKKDLIG
jgi:putative membrane protein